MLARLHRNQPPLAAPVVALVALVSFGLFSLVFAGHDTVRTVNASSHARVIPLPGWPKRHASVPLGSRPPARRLVPSAPLRGPVGRPSDAQIREMIGQKLMVGFVGPSPPADLLARVRAGEVGGVILMGMNPPPSATTVRSIATQLQSAARAGHQPGVLIATDQEGGTVKRIQGIAPTLSAAAMGQYGSRVALAQGRETGRGLRYAGVNVDLAPVTDTEIGPSFLTTRSFGTTPSRVAAAAGAFASGLRSEGVAATAKHFPGLGHTGGQDTDTNVVRAPSWNDQLSAFYSVVQRVPLVMVSSAIYPGSHGLPAILSGSVINGLLRSGLHFGGVVISDEMHAPAVKAYGASAPRMATNAGADILLYSKGDDRGLPYQALLNDYRSGRVPVGTLRASYDRIMQLKRSLGLA